VRLYHYTCFHGARAIERDGQLRGNPHPFLPTAGPLIHLTDLDQPDRYGLGLTSFTLECDRTEYRCTVDTDAATHWPAYARRMPRALRERFEDCPGALPMHWYIATEPVAVLDVQKVVAA
jgi:hypothetical protein